MPDQSQIVFSCIELLKQLIAVQSYSREESGTAEVLARFFKNKNIRVKRHLKNIWVHNFHYDPSKPTILLNSHHDTVKPNSGYTRNPFSADVEDGKLFGLGSNDAGGPLVALIGVFIHFYDCKNLNYNLCLAATAEEEISGNNGIEAILDQIGAIDFAIVGEPTGMQMAIAEKGLMVVDCTVTGKAGHAAREEGENAIYKALPDIEWFRVFQFPKISELFGAIKMSVTVINSGSQHNVVPAMCTFTVDIRITEQYTNEEVLDVIRRHVSCNVVPRSTRLRPSFIDPGHPIVLAGKKLGLSIYGSPTLSDQALIPAPSIKIGPGDSARSHIADEFIWVKEIEEGITLYGKILESLLT